MKAIQRIAVLLFFFTINFEMWDPLYTGGYFSLSRLTGLIYLGLMLPAIIRFRTPGEAKPALRPLWYFFLVLTVVSYFNMKAELVDFFNMTIFQNIVLLWILVNHETIDHLILEKALLSFAAGAVVLAVLFKLGIGINYDPVSYRTTIFEDNANNVGIRMSISLIIIALAIIQNRLQLGRIRYLALAGVPFIFETMIATGSRVSFIAFVSAYFVFLLLYQSKSKWVKPVIVFCGFAIILIIWQVVLKSEMITERLLQSLTDGDLSERDEVWRRVLPIWNENPIWGVGTTGYEYLTSYNIGRTVSPHNVILEILCLSGVVGLFFYLVFLFRIFRIGWKTFTQNGSLQSLLLLIPVGGLLLSAQLLQVKIGWVIFAYIIAHDVYRCPKDIVGIPADKGNLKWLHSGELA